MTDFAVIGNRVRYTAWAPIYDRVVGLAGFTAARAASISALQLGSADRVLIAGAGTGLDLAYVPAEVTVAAFDVTPAMVQRLRRRAATSGRHVSCQIADARRMPYADETFDAVVLHLILAVMPEPARGLAEATRVLRPGGRIAIFDKFLPQDERPSAARRAANLVARVLFSDINVRFEDLVGGLPLTIERHQAAGFRGLYRTLTLRKDADLGGTQRPDATRAAPRRQQIAESSENQTGQFSSSGAQHIHHVLPSPESVSAWRRSR